jgi:hypothetical protein
MRFRLFALALALALANQTAAGAPGAVYLVRGLSSEVVDATGTPITGTFTHSGYIENLCDTLA